jgi:succinyl-CoA synthetase beta subunit
VKIHEYQAKKILGDYGVTVADGIVVESEADIDAGIAQVQEVSGRQDVVVKAQVHAGGRGKAGGVKYVRDTAAAQQAARDILGMTLVSPQTGPEGILVRKIYITAAIDIAQEYYLALTLDRSTERIAIIVSTEGGVEIEEVAESDPDAIVKVWVDPVYGLQPYHCRAVVKTLGLTGTPAKLAMRMVAGLYKTYVGTDASLVEINPLVLTEDDDIVALDAKFSFDDNALYRHKEIAAMRDFDEEDPTEVEADKYHLNYIKLDGNVGCMVNGAGLAMATMDIIKLKGGEPANFLDVGGAANVETVKNGFRIILSDPAVKAVLINVFGGIVRCDRIANGIIAAVKELDLNVPVVVRLEGTNAIEAKDILANSGVSIIAAGSLDDAATKVVNAATGN